MDMTSFIKRLEKGPTIGKAVYIAPNATVLGDVSLGDDVSIWHSAVLRGDVNFIKLGHGSNAQDGAVLHVGADRPVVVGDNVSIAHCVCLHGCTIGDNTLIGNGAIVLDGAEIGSNCIVAAGSVVPPGKKFPDGSMIMGNPAKVTRQLTGLDLDMIARNSAHYRQYKMIYLEKKI
ncbi:MAG: gamma carbonic anhydrase family protein [Deferribacteraceae bacterium]|jgi:carbonic anhydrase/acetyltransferase-like protein (isoleucine patch superfamily)|nr:gamma carbonic anhydrase family protein [Deferribacteraceae bacterium]